MSEDRYIQLDESGFFVINQSKITDLNVGKQLLDNLSVEPLKGFTTRDKDGAFFVESFDAPLVVQDLKFEKQNVTALSNYGYQFPIDLNKIYFDNWDRFLGYDFKNRPFVLSKKAQNIFFDNLDEFDDDSITYGGKKYLLTPWMSTMTSTSEESFWNKKYQEVQTPGWELGKASPIIVNALPQLKIPRSRIFVPGCGSGNDAAYLAEQGHIVTAVDYSEEAIHRAKAKYGHIKNLVFEKQNIFNLPNKYANSFDLVVEHTLFCAVPNENRQDLVRVWKRSLTERGHLLAILFVMEQKSHPPFGGSEWEYRQRLKSDFRFLYWTRSRDSEGWRKATELLIYAQVKERLS